jgi:hypothetical protein
MLQYCSTHLCQHSNMELPDHSSFWLILTAVLKDCKASFFTHTYICCHKNGHGDIPWGCHLYTHLSSTHPWQYICLCDANSRYPTVRGLQPCLIRTGAPISGRTCCLHHWMDTAGSCKTWAPIQQSEWLASLQVTIKRTSNFIQRQILMLDRCKCWVFISEN